jgi:anti-sigma regulatory factor (Ser/Thr protein kinase)
VTRVRERGEDIRRYIIENAEKHPTNISKTTAQHFKITRQAVSKHLQRLTDEKILAQTGQTRSRIYKLSPLVEWRQAYDLKGGIAIPEDVIWTNDIRLALGKLPDNVLAIWHHGFTEMFNNAIDHSDGSRISVRMKKNAAETKMQISDNGIGIFKKIQTALNLLDERHAVLELAKGKLTTDPARHSGEGIFFTSRMFDSFAIVSGDVVFTHNYGQKEDWIHADHETITGTHVFMDLHNHTSRTTKKVFDQFTTEEDFTFSKTVVPVKLAKYGDDNLISRSQAKRLLSRVELFKVVILDFDKVPTIGQAFADEIFRVFANEHPNIQFEILHASSEVRRMIERVKTTVSAMPPKLIS